MPVSTNTERQPPHHILVMFHHHRVSNMRYDIGRTSLSKEALNLTSGPWKISWVVQLLQTSQDVTENRFQVVVPPRSRG